MNFATTYEEEFYKVKDSIEATFANLCKLWDKIGNVNESKRDNAKNSLICSCAEAIDFHLNNVYETEYKIMVEYNNRIKEEETSISELCSLLEISIDNIWYDKEGRDLREYCSLRKQERHIKKFKGLLLSQCSEQRIRVIELLEKLKSLYNELGEEMSPSLDRSEECISLDYIRILEDHYNQSCATREERKQSVPNIVNILMEYYNLFGITQENTSNEVDLFLLSHPESVPITSLMIFKLDKRVLEMKQLKEEREECMKEYSIIIDDLWTKLQTSEEERESFRLRIGSDLSEATLLIYEDYIQILKEKVIDQLRLLIPNLRDDIQNLKNYIDFYSTALSAVDFSILDVEEYQFTIELYEAHNQLFNLLQNENEKLQPVISKLEEKEYLSNCKKEYEELRQDPTRLTGRDSFRKLKREQELERIVKSKIPLFNKELLAVISEYEAQYGEIIINGERYIEVLQSEIEAANKSKGNARVSIFASR